MRAGMNPRALVESPLLIALAGAVALGGATMSARAALTAITSDSVTVPITDGPAPQPLSERGASATGYFDLPADLAAATPARFTAPVGAAVTAAPSIAFRGRTAIDSVRAAQCLASAIYYEAASEGEDGQRAVAQVVLNRVRHPAFPNSVCGVVYQGSGRATGCQFSFTCDGALARSPSAAGYTQASRVAHQALAGRVYAPVGNATHYHTFRVWPAWGKSLVMTAAVGAHFFHRWKGYWGTPQAFGSSYSGVEPAIAPWAPLAIEASHVPVPPPADVATSAKLPPPVIEPAIDQPPVTLPPSTILDRWKDTGKPLR